MSMRQSPPKQSPAHRARKAVGAHAGIKSVGHNVGTRKPKTILDPNNGQDGDRTYPYPAPGARGPATTNS